MKVTKQHLNEALCRCRGPLINKSCSQDCKKTRLFGADPDKCHVIALSLFFFLSANGDCDPENDHSYKY